MKRKLGIVLGAMLLTILSSVSAFAADTTKAVTVKIPVSCSCDNSSESFQIKLNSSSEEFQIVESETLLLKNGENSAFSIEYTVPGKYHYTISQEKGSDSKTTYDSTVYDVDVYVAVDENDVMYAEPIIYIQGSKDKKDSIFFTNKKEVIISSITNPSPSKHNSIANIVKTGDASQVGFWLMLCICSLSCILIGVILGKSSERRRA